MKNSMPGGCADGGAPDALAGRREFKHDEILAEISKHGGATGVSFPEGQTEHGTWWRYAPSQVMYGAVNAVSHSYVFAPVRDRCQKTTMVNFVLLCIEVPLSIV
jgi:hypothetical protein